MKEILIDIHQGGDKLCVLKDGALDEFWLERRDAQKHVGNIYKGKVMNVLPGMQACFVDIGLEKNAFLYAGDVCVNGKMLSHNGSVTPDKFPLRAGDVIMCQALKDEFGAKGCRVSMNISVPSHNLVMVPLIDYVCVSRKIADEERKKELESIVTQSRNNDFGYIIRTESQSASNEEIVEDMQELTHEWAEIKDKFIKSPVGTLLFNDGGLITRAMRDILRSDIDSVVVNNAKTYNEILQEFKQIVDKSPSKFKLYNSAESMMSHYGVESQIDALADRTVPLSNGAYLVIDRTEALTIVDVNTGKYVGDINLEQTVYVTNKIAAVEIARQLRLRNIGGIVIIDFIDMRESCHKDELMSLLKEEFAKDRVKCVLVGMTELGLVQVTRKKTRSMIDDVLLQTCPYCNGNGVVLSEENMIMKIRDYLVEMFSVNKHINAVKLYVNDKVFAKLFSLRYLEEECSTIWAGKRVYVIPEPTLHVEKYECIKVTTNIIDLPNSAKLLY